MTFHRLNLHGMRRIYSLRKRANIFAALLQNQLLAEILVPPHHVAATTSE